MLRDWISKKRFWVCLFLLPLPIHILPMLNYIPDWKEKKYLLYLIVVILVISLIIGSLILFWITPSFIAKAKKIILTIITSLILIVHGAAFFFITVFSELDLGSREVTLTEEVNRRTVYVFENFGLFHIHTSCEIAYKVKYLPLYTTYYATSNHLQLKKKSSRWILFNEYEKIPIEKDIKDVYDLIKKRQMRERPIKDILFDIDKLN